MEVIDRYRAQIPYLMVLSASSNMPLLWGTSLDCGGMSGIGVQNGLMLAAPRLVKRALDIAISAAVILAGLPLFALVALLVKVSSRGPVFFGHRRLGFGGKSFRAWKFRTMRPNADKLLQKYLDSNPDARAEWEESFKLRKDPRVTWIGHFLRKSSLDEFPQLWNVIRGEMSLVGPRPIIADEAEKYGRVFKLYTDVKPGITGLWQVSGRNNTSYEERVQLDNYYVRNWSPWLDIHILARTVSTLIRGSGAY
jgi:Undecaprenyl-phosphate galactose phosphotransferase WbaP